MTVSGNGTGRWRLITPRGVGICLGLGLFVNVLSAWVPMAAGWRPGVSVFSPIWHPMAVEDTRQLWLSHGAPKAVWDRFRWADMTLVTWQRTFSSSSLPNTPVDRTILFAVRSGWPFRALATWGIDEKYTGSRAWTLNHVGRIQLTPEGATDRYLPFIPIPSGFVFNTAFYSGVFFCAGQVVHRWRRGHRVLSGKCPECAYDLLQIPNVQACPECGTPSPPVSGKHKNAQTYAS